MARRKLSMQGRIVGFVRVADVGLTDVGLTGVPEHDQRLPAVRTTTADAYRR